MEENSHPLMRSYGRIKSRPIKPRQAALFDTLLPAVAVPDPKAGPVDPRALMPEATEAWLEIGFGGGEHLLSAARAHPRIGFIGCEPFINGMAKFLAVIEREGLRNIRLWDGDAALMLPRLPACSLDAIDLLYPDPWPKRRQRKRRFVSEHTLGLFARALRAGGRFRFASDIDDYIGWTLSRLMASPDFDWTDERPGDWRTPYPGWIRTRYEAKAVREGRISSYLTALRRAS